MIAIKTQNQPLQVNETFEVIHPLYDVQEQKRTGENLGRMKLTTGVKIVLFTLRAYLILMGGLLAYHVLDLVGVFGHHIAK